MPQKRLSVNCLVQVKSDNRLDFEEWLNYHLALGFDAIFVCDSGNRQWLDELCAKKGDRVVLAPRDERWQYKSDIIADYVSRREYEEWCVCMDDHDFLWIAPSRARSIVEYAEMIPGRIAAVTFYVKHMSSKEPMRYRVGTQLDCFTHARPEPEGFHPRYAALPNSGVTMFRVVDRKMPLRDPVTPVYANAWIDSEFRQMTPARYADETNSPRFRPTAYSVRIYRYAIRSGAEMDFDNSLVPQGFDVLDLSMQKAREQFLHIPVNQDTETLFAKKDPPPKEDKIAGVMTENQVQVARAISAEAGLPLSRARIDKLIFKGQFFEDILKYAESKDPNVDRDLLYRVFEQERKNIVATSSLYTTLQEMVDQGKDDAEIRRTLCVTETTLNLMKKALPVLAIETEYAVDEPAADRQEIQVNLGAPAPEPAPDDTEPELADAVSGFEESIEASAPSEDEMKAREAALAEMDSKRANRAPAVKKEKKAPKKKASAKVVAGSVKKVEVKGQAKKAAPKPEPAPESPAEPGDDDLGLDGIDGSMLDEINVDAVIGNVQAAPDAKN